MSEQSDNGWVKLWHKRGCQVTIPLRGDITTFDKQIEYLFDAGFLAQAPGLEDGEEKEMVGWVLRSMIEKDGESTPFLLLYAANDALKWSVLKIYLNTDDDIAAFEFASKMRLDALPEYVGNDKPARGAAAKTDKFIVQAPRPFGVVYRKNPKHDPNTEEGKLKPARLFVRWADQRPAAPADETPLAAHTRAITTSLTIESLQQAFAAAYKDGRLSGEEVAALTRLKDERKAAVGKGGMYAPAGGHQNTAALKG